MDFESIFNSIKSAIIDLIDFIIEVVNHAISMAIDIVNWFKKKYKELRKYTVYLITVVKLKQMTKGSPVGELLGSEEIPTIEGTGIYDDDEKYSEGIAEVIVNNETETIDTLRILGGSQGIADDLRNVMKDKDAVQLA